MSQAYKTCRNPDCPQVQPLPATAEYFRARPDSRDGLRTLCRICYQRSNTESHRLWRKRKAAGLVGLERPTETVRLCRNPNCADPGPHPLTDQYFYRIKKDYYAGECKACRIAYINERRRIQRAAARAKAREEAERLAKFRRTPEQKALIAHAKRVLSGQNTALNIRRKARVLDWLHLLAKMDAAKAETLDVPMGAFGLIPMTWEEAWRGLEVAVGR